MSRIRYLVSRLFGGAKSAVPPSEQRQERVYDFSNFEAPRFKYKVRLHKPDKDGVPQDDEIQTNSIDMDAALLDLQQRCGRIFQEVHFDGRQMSGYSVLQECRRTFKQPPTDLPTLQEVSLSIRKVFSLPGDMGLEASLFVLDGFLEEAMGRILIKKERPVSPDSSAPTPA